MPLKPSSEGRSGEGGWNVRVDVSKSGVDFKGFVLCTLSLCSWRYPWKSTGTQAHKPRTPNIYQVAMQQNYIRPMYIEQPCNKLT